MEIFEMKKTEIFRSRKFRNFHWKLYENEIDEKISKSKNFDFFKCRQLFSFSKKSMIFFIDRGKIVMRRRCRWLERPQNEFQIR